MINSFDDTVDLVVVGFGGAGAATALRGAELGASVTILEKQRRDEHTPNTGLSGGLIMGVNDVDKGMRYLHTCGGGMIPEDVSRAWAAKATTMVPWLEEQGADLNLVRIGGAEHPEFEGADAIDVYRMAKRQDGTLIDHSLFSGTTGQQAAGGGNPAMAAAIAAQGAPLASGRDYFAHLRAVVEKRDTIRVEYGVGAQKLLRDDDGRVVGVERSDGRRIRGEAGVVLTCGGYEYSDDMKLNYLKAFPMYFYGNPGNTGDGVRMAQEAGADLWHMNQMVGRGIGHFEFEDGRELNVVILVAGGGFVITDKHGHRFANEQPQADLKHGFYYHLLQYDPDRDEYPRIPCYWFFDGRRIATPLTSPTAGLVGAGYYDWSPDNSKEIAAGWIKTADTIEKLAELVGITDPSAAATEVAAYNSKCRDGEADPFGRPAAGMIPLEPPYYCIPLYPGGSNTCGGPRRNARAEILTPFGTPISGLYGAGELGEAVGLLYPADGSNLSESIAFGRIAAEVALTGSMDAAEATEAPVRAAS